MLFDSWTTDRKIANTGSEFPVDTGSAANKTSPNYLITTHQTEARTDPPSKKATINVIFDNLNV